MGFIATGLASGDRNASLQAPRPKRKRPPEGGYRRALLGMKLGREGGIRPLCHANSVMRGFLRDVLDIRADDAEVVQLTIRQAGEFTHGSAIAAPFLDLVRDFLDRHGSVPITLRGVLSRRS